MFIYEKKLQYSRTVINAIEEDSIYSIKNTNILHDIANAKIYTGITNFKDKER